MPYCSHCGIQLTEGASFCHVCGASVTSVSGRSTHQTFNVNGVPRVVISSRSPGSIEISRSNKESEIEADVILKEESYLEWNITQNGDVIAGICRPKMGVLEFPGGFSLQGARADFILKVPKQTILDLTNRFGEITVRGVEGPSISAESSVGSIRISDFEGTANVRTKTGLLSLENLKGRVSARNSAGSITYSGSLSLGDSSFSTKVGNIEITLGGDLNLKIDASSRVGRVTVDPSIKEAQFQSEQYGIGNRIYCTIGTGALRLFSETLTGTISIQHSTLQK